MTKKEQIVEIVMSCEPPINLTIQPGFDHSACMRWYVAKAVEITTKVVFKDLEFTLYKENKVTPY